MYDANSSRVAHSAVLGRRTGLMLEQSGQSGSRTPDYGLQDRCVPNYANRPWRAGF